MDPFSILGVARSYDVNLGLVEKTHRELSRTLHPDRFVGAGASERRAALAKAIEVNEAWRILRDPIRRAEALLALDGKVARDEAEVRRSDSDPEFLMDMLEQREKLADARTARDGASVRALGEAIRERSAAVEREISAGFSAGQTDSLVGKLGQLRFFRRFLEEVGDIEDELAT